MIQLTRGQKIVLITTSVPMSAVGIAGGIASYLNFADLLDHASMAVSVVLAGEGATLVAALAYLLLTLLGQHTPKVVRAALWLLPVTGSVAGGLLAASTPNRVVMVVAPLAMTVAAEGVALVARRVVRFQTGVDLEQQRRSGLLLWHANRAANGGWYGRRVSRLAVWRLTRAFAETDTQMSVQLGEVQRYRIAEGSDANLAAALSGQRRTPVSATVAPSAALAAPAAVPVPALAPKPVTEAPAVPTPVAKPETAEADSWDFIQGVLTEAEQNVAIDTTVKLLTVADVASLKGVSAGTVRSWVSRGKLPVAGKDADGRNQFHPLAVAEMD
jgi:hypothetical protein